MTCCHGCTLSVLGGLCWEQWMYAECTWSDVFVAMHGCELQVDEDVCTT